MAPQTAPCGNRQLHGSVSKNALVDISMWRQSSDALATLITVPEFRFLGFTAAVQSDSCPKAENEASEYNTRGEARV